MKHIRKVTLDLVGRYRVGVEPVVYLVLGENEKKKRHNATEKAGGGE